MGPLGPSGPWGPLGPKIPCKDFDKLCSLYTTKEVPSNFTPDIVYCITATFVDITEWSSNSIKLSTVFAVGEEGLIIPEVVDAATVYSPATGIPSVGISGVPPSSISILVPDPVKSALLPSVSDETECASFDKITVSAPVPSFTLKILIVSVPTISSNAGSAGSPSPVQPSGL